MGDCRLTVYILSCFHRILLPKRAMKMIKYDKLWKTMKAKGVSQYKLIKDYKVSTGQIDRLRKNSNVSTYTLNQLCKILDCKIEDIAEYIPDED